MQKNSISIHAPLSIEGNILFKKMTGPSPRQNFHYGLLS